MSNSDAIALVGDGDGKIDVRLHASLGNAKSTPFQTRFGIKERRVGLDINDENQALVKTWQLGKGTFAPRDLSDIGNGYDLIISSDQLKGRVQEEEWGRGRVGERGKDMEGGSTGARERGKEEGANISSSLPLSPSLPPNSLIPSLSPSPTAIKPGEYIMTMGIGNKTDAYYGITSTGAQFWNSFPQGVENDVLPLLERRLEELKNIADDPRKIAQDYINSMDAR